MSKLDKQTPGKELGVYSENFYPRPAEESEPESMITDEEIISLNKTTPIPVDSGSNKRPKKDIAHVLPDVDDGENQNLSNITCGVCFQILLDPISLGCGHSFCELCLAGMWKANRHPIPLCPMCREPWGRPGERLPSVNVMLRDLIEQMYPKKLKERRESISGEEKALLKTFSESRTVGTRPRLAHRVGVNIPIPRAFFCILAVVFIVTMLLAMLLVSGAIWLFGYSEVEYMLKPVKEWDNEDVLQWMNGLGETVRKDCLEVFEKEKIDGPHLLRLTDLSLSNQLGVENEFTRDSLLLSIQELKERQRQEPRNFREFRAANREEIVLVTLLYKFYPRLTFLYLYLAKYHSMFLPLVKSQLNIRSKIEEDERATVMMEDNEEDLEDVVMENQDQILGEEYQDEEDEVVKELMEDLKEWVKTREGGVDEKTEDKPKSMKKEEPSEPSRQQLLAIAVEILLVPHVVVMAFVYNHFSKGSLLFYALLFHSGLSTFVELKMLRNKLRNPRGRQQYSLSMVFKTFINSIIGYFVTFFVGLMIYLILPAFIVDLIFYAILLQPLLFIFYHFFLKSCLLRTFRFLIGFITVRLAQRGGV